MSVAYAKKIEVTGAKASVIEYEFLSGCGPAGTFVADLSDPSHVHPSAPNEVTANVGSSGVIYFMKTYLTARSVPPGPYYGKYPLSLGLDEPASADEPSPLQ